MSVLLPNIKIFTVIHDGLITAASRTTCDVWYSEAIRERFIHMGVDDQWVEASRLVKSWCELNELSFKIAYKQGFDTKQNKITTELLHGKYNACQLLKYLLCVIYNIELDTIEKEQELTTKQYADFKLLKKWKDELAFNIIAALPDYDNAKWSDMIKVD